MRAAVYARLSKRSDDGANIPQQVRNGKAAVKRRDWTLADVYVDDGVSAWKPGVERPQFQLMLEAARAGEIDVIVVREVDRLTRNPGDWGDLSRTGVQIATHSGELLDRFAIGILASVATKESDVRSERQLLAEERRLAKGLPPRGGNRHFGYHSGRCCPTDKCEQPDVRHHGECCGGSCVPHVVCDSEAAVVLELADRWLAGEAMRALARDLNNRGIKTTRGGQWTHINLKKLLRSPRLAGIRIHERDGEVREHRGNWEPVIDADLHARLVLADGGSVSRRAPERYPLTGLLVCSRCSDPDANEWVTLNGHMHRAGKRRYACLTCRANGIAAAPVEDALWNHALSRTWEREGRAEADVAAQLKGAEKRLSVARSKLDELDDDYYSDLPTIDKRTHTRRGAKLRQTIAFLEGESERLRRERNRVSGFWQSLIALDDTHRTASPERRRAVLEGAVRRVVLATNAGKRGGRVDLSRVRITWMDGTVTDGIPPDPPVWEPATPEVVTSTHA